MESLIVLLIVLLILLNIALFVILIKKPIEKEDRLSKFLKMK